jgi:hypothetical protein
MRATSEPRTVARRVAVGFVLWSTLTLESSEVRAQAELGKADALFNAGRSLLEAGEYSDACPKFAESQGLAPGLGVTLYLADCYERLGRTASALLEFRRAREIASKRGDKRGVVADERAASLESRVPELVIVVTRAARAQGVTVTRDGEFVPSTQWDEPIQMDPGDHVVLVVAPGKEERRLNATLDGRKGVVAVVVDGLIDPLPPARLAPSPKLEDRPEPDADPLKTRRWTSFAVGGAGLFGVAVGVVLGSLAVSKLHESNDGPCDATDHCTAAGLAFRQDAEHFGNAATGAFVVGGATLAAAAVLYFTIPMTRRASGIGLTIDPVLSDFSMGLRAGSLF